MNMSWEIYVLFAVIAAYTILVWLMLNITGDILGIYLR